RTPRKPRPGAIVESASRRLVLPAPLAPVRTTKRLSMRKSSAAYERNSLSMTRETIAPDPACAACSAIDRPSTKPIRRLLDLLSNAHRHQHVECFVACAVAHQSR